MPNLRDAILATTDRRLKPVKGEGLPAGMFVGKLTAGQVEDLTNAREKPHASARWFIAFVRDRDGAAIFGEDDAEAISALPAAVVGPVNTAGFAFNNLGDADAGKNSEATPGEDSSSS